MQCPIHKIELLSMHTKYGPRYCCSERGCTVVAWGGDTSTPADKETRDMRRQAHNAFDTIWKQKIMRRTTAYRKLSKYLGLRKSKTHIGMFDKETCEKVIEFSIKILSRRA